MSTGQLILRVMGIVNQEMTVLVVGQGYVGLPLCQYLTTYFTEVTGYDVDKNRVLSLNAGVSHISDVSDARSEERRVGKECY
jgi:UDP-N-acetyl-D-mannosaminuronate dehydrogenase